MGEAPTFSIIIPVYNRAGMIGRALESCLRQDYPSFEVIIVDDASSDHTSERVASYNDPRVTLLRHPVNRGVCAARNTAIDAARGAWCIMLDSDFELLDGALSGLAKLCAEAAPDVGNVASMCTWDNGPDTPIPPPSEDAVYDYEGYVRYWGALRIPESFNCIRRSVFETLRYPEGRAYEGGFHLEMARTHRFSLTRQRFVLIHTDANNRITASPPAATARRLLRDARDSADDFERTLQRHGEVMARVSPALHNRFIQTAVMHRLLAGQRAAALRLVRSAPRSTWRMKRLWVVVGAGLVGPEVLAYVQANGGELMRRLRSGGLL